MTARSARRVRSDESSTNQAAYAEPLPQSSAGRCSTVLDVLAERRAGAARRARPPVPGRCRRDPGSRRVRRSPGTTPDRRGRPTRGRRPGSSTRNRGATITRSERRESVDRLDDLAAAAHPRRTAVEAERHVGPERGGLLRGRLRTRASTAAASAEPPPRPAPGGIPLCSVDRHRAVQQMQRRAATRLSSSLGTPAANGPVTRDRGRRRGRGARACRAARSPTP